MRTVPDLGSVSPPNNPASWPHDSHTIASLSNRVFTPSPLLEGGLGVEGLKPSNLLDFLGTGEGGLLTRGRNYR